MPSEASTCSLPRCLRSRRHFFLLLAGYFGLQIVLRLVTSATVDLDESEQFVLTQSWRWGYGPQPPLFNWVQKLFFAAFGPSLFALSLWKNLLLFGTYCFTYATARRVTRSHLAGVLAALSLLFVPQIVWESQRDLTHTVLATTLATATLFLFVRLREEAGPARYLWLGVCFAAGLLGNYNYALFLLGLLGAALLGREFRGCLLRPAMLLALGLAAALVLPHFLWVLHHPDWALASSGKLNVQAATPWIDSFGRGLLSLFKAVLTHTLAPVLVYALLVWKRVWPRRGSDSAGSVARLIFRGIAVSLLVLIAVVAGFRVTGFRDRWFQPVLISLPVGLALVAGSSVTALAVRRLFGLGGLVALAVSLAMPGRIWLEEATGRNELLNAPFEALAASLRERVAAADLLVCENLWLGGNLRRQFHGTPVITTEFPDPSLIPAAGKCLVIWDARKHPLPPAPLKELAQAISSSEIQTNAISHAEAVFKRHRAKRMLLGVARLETSAVRP